VLRTFIKHFSQSIDAVTVIIKARPHVGS